MALERALKTRDIVLFNVAAIVGMRWIALAAANGPSSLLLWVLAAVAFFIPQGFAVIALASAIPEEGGLYVWTTRAFGQRQGFLAGWLYWASNILYFPTPDRFRPSSSRSTSSGCASRTSSRAPSTRPARRSCCSRSRSSSTSSA